MTHHLSSPHGTLALSMEEAQILEKVLRHALDELRLEVRHTDTREYREKLSREREVLQNLLDRIGPELISDLKQAT